MRQASERVSDANPAFEKSLIGFGCHAIAGGFRDDEIESAHNGFGFCGGSKSLLRKCNLRLIESDVCANSGSPCSCHDALL